MGRRRDDDGEDESRPRRRRGPETRQTARYAIGNDVDLFVDANGAYSVQEALAWSQRFGELGVAYFEEPVSSDDLAGLRRVRDGSPGGMDITAGEYN